MTILLWVCVAIGFAAGFVRRGWLAVPASLLVGLVPGALGLTWQDGDPIGVSSVWTMAWPATTALGYALHWRLKSRRGHRTGAADERNDLDPVA